MPSLSRIKCYFGHHLRSRGRARRSETGWSSYCKRCGIPMYKEDGGEWYAEADPSDDDASNDADAPDGTARDATARAE